MAIRTILAELPIYAREAVRFYWQTRSHQSERQRKAGGSDQGLRSAVTGGAQMNGFFDLFSKLVIEAGIDAKHIYHRDSLELPGYFRPSKRWDFLVVAQGQLIVALEAKSQVGPSFGNNFNNRTEEAIGNAEDIWIAYREGRFGRHPAPFLGYFFLLEDCAKVHAPVSSSEPYFKVDPVFEGASYARRYEVLCERLVLERKYTSACLALATKDDPAGITFPADALNFRQFAAAIDAHARAFINTR